MKIEGTVGGMTFYRSSGEYLVREKGGVDGNRIKNDPTFERTRENNSEFGAAGSASKLMRDALRVLIMSAADSRLTARFTALMMNILKLDGTSARGQRIPSVGITTVEGRALLKGFNFNEKSILGTVLYRPYTMDTATGVISITGLVPLNDIANPAGATHLSLRGAMADINLATGEVDVQLTNTVNIPINNSAVDVTLTPAAVAAGTGIKLFLLKVEFFQEVNATQYTLRNGAFNSMAIIETA